MNDFYNTRTMLQDIKERYEKQKKFRVGTVDHSLTHGKEYHYFLKWSGSGEKIINYTMDYYKGKIYYLDHGYLFQSDENGNDQKVLIEIEDYFNVDSVSSMTYSQVFVSVNNSGIYLYEHGNKSTIIRFSLEGEYIQTRYIKGEMLHAYIFESRIYYVLNVTTKKQSVNYMDMKDGVKHTIFEAGLIMELYGDYDKVVMRAQYSKSKSGVEVSAKGWYLYSLKEEKAFCLSSKEYPPHRVMEYPEDFMEEKKQYINNRKRIIIRSIDLTKDIMWVATYLKEKTEDGIQSMEYWEPRKLAVEGEAITDLPIWRLTPAQFGTGENSIHVSEASYFDGNCFLNGRGVYTMKCYDIEGKCTSYGLSADKGACNRFRVLHGYIYADFDGKGWEQYKIEEHQLTFIRKCWFAISEKISDDAVEAIMLYKRKKRNVKK